MTELMQQILERKRARRRALAALPAALAKKMPHRVEKLPRKTDDRGWKINPIPGKIYHQMIHTKGVPHTSN
jgi:hypothetical protein